ncbi:MAG: electron transfer flavoprotein subunit beta/FixA family protein [Treponema sp.]|nr:electron transfer flavoprotein subunit beta/FixA family protein [Treponema sp.]
MKIIVCIKQVPGTDNASIDPVTKRIVREGIKSILNPFDLYAIEEGIRMRERFGGEVIALSMGPEKAVNSLREAIAIGADSGVLLSDRAFGGSDTWATSYALYRAIETIGGVDLVICGKQAMDGDTAQIGPGIAAHLDWQQATYVIEIKNYNSGCITAVRMNENGSDLCELRLPAVLTVVKGINQPRVPTLKGVLAANACEIKIWKPADIGADLDRIGLEPSPTRVVKTQPPLPRGSVTQSINGSSSECAGQLIASLRQRGLIEGGRA